MKNRLMSKGLAEALGTFAIVFFGCGAIMVAERFPGSVSSAMIPVVFGLVVAAMIYAVGHISGAHFNPAVTLGFAVTGRFPKTQIGLYWAAQFLGALIAMLCLWGLLPIGSGYGATIPHVSILQALGWEFVLSFFLMFVIIAVATDSRAVGVMAGAAIGSAVAFDAVVGGSVTGASMNPARSLAPALFQGRLDTLWLYFVGPALGTLAASLLYEKIRCDVIGKKEDEIPAKVKDASGCC